MVKPSGSCAVFSRRLLGSSRAFRAAADDIFCLSVYTPGWKSGFWPVLIK